MRKTIITGQEPKEPSASGWLDLEAIASVEITSEGEGTPIEQALHPQGMGWRAASTGPQIIRLLFEQPTHVETVQLHIVEKSEERGQELAIYARVSGAELRQIVRQQFNFSPNGSTEEFEEMALDLNDVEVLEIRIDPDRAHNPADSRHYATLASLKIS